MKKTLLSLVLILIANTGFAGDIVYKCTSKTMGKFSVGFQGKQAFTDFENLIDRSDKPGFYELVRDDEYEDEDDYQLYTYATRDGTAEFYFEKPFSSGGRKMKNGRGGGYVFIKISFRSGLRLPQEHTAVCFAPTK